MSALPPNSVYSKFARSSSIDSTTSRPNPEGNATFSSFLTVSAAPPLANPRALPPSPDITKHRVPSLTPKPLDDPFAKGEPAVDKLNFDIKPYTRIFGGKRAELAFKDETTTPQSNSKAPSIASDDTERPQKPIKPSSEAKGKRTKDEGQSKVPGDVARPPIPVRQSSRTLIQSTTPNLASKSNHPKSPSVASGSTVRASLSFNRDKAEPVKERVEKKIERKPSLTKQNSFITSLFPQDGNTATNGNKNLKKSVELEPPTSSLKALNQLGLTTQSAKAINTLTGMGFTD